MSSEVDVVTGAFSYTGRHIAARLIAEGRKVRTLTGRTRPAEAPQIETFPYVWDRAALARSLEGADTFYNTYWVRLHREGRTFEATVKNSSLLFEAARDAGVRKIVHVSISNAGRAPHLPYFAGKAEVEKRLTQLGVPFAIVRPTVVFGADDVLINNIAWLLRRFPLFVIADDGRYRVRPVHVEDVARICCDAGRDSSNSIRDAVGPDVLSFEEIVQTIRSAVGSSSRIVHAPKWLVMSIARLLSVFLRDELIAPGELLGLMDELVSTDGLATGEISFRAWVASNAASLGRSYTSEMKRNYRRR